MFGRFYLIWDLRLQSRHRNTVNLCKRTSHHYMQAMRKGHLSNTTVITQTHPETSHECPIENGTMMGGGWDVDGTWDGTALFT